MRPRFRATCNNNQSTSRSLIRAIWSPFRASFHTLDFAETMGPSAMLPSSAFSSGFDLRLQGLYLRVSGSGRPSGPALLRRNNQSALLFSICSDMLMSEVNWFCSFNSDEKFIFLTPLHLVACLLKVRAYF